MRMFRPLVPPKVVDPTSYWKLFRQISDHLQQLQAAIKLLGDGRSPDQSSDPIPGIPKSNDHGDLDGLVPVYTAGGKVSDYNDDHTQYAHLPGRIGGQTLNGSRIDANTAWSDKGKFVEAEVGTDGTSWSSIAISQDAAVNDVVILAVFTRPLSLSGADDEETNLHSTITDTGSNTWTKLKEYSTLDGSATVEENVSIWYAPITTALTAGSDTLTFTSSVSMHRRIIVARLFKAYSGAVVTLASSTFGKATGAAPEALTLGALSGNTLYFRALAYTYGADPFTLTPGFVDGISPATSHAGSSIYPGTEPLAGRVEFLSSTAASATSDPSFPTSFDHEASIFAALQLSTASPGHLELKSIAVGQPAEIDLNDQTIDMNADFINFRAPGGTDTLSYIDGSTGAFEGPIHDFNGTFGETFDALVTSDGATVTMSLEQPGTGDLTMRFSDGYTTLDCTPAATIALTAGTDSSPQKNYVYVLQSTKAITLSTTEWPSVEHIKVGFFLVPSAGFVQTSGCYINQNWNDHITSTNEMGHVAHLAEALRTSQGGAQYFSGLAGAGTSDYLTLAGTTVDFKMDAGVVYQLHQQTIAAVDTSAGDVLLVQNWSGDPFHDITNLYDIVADSTGANINNNKYFNLVVWGVGNKGGEYSPVIINLPGGVYNTQADAKADTSGYDDFTIPREYALDSSTAFLLCRITVQKNIGAWTYVSTVDLRGALRSVGSAGGSGSVGPANTILWSDGSASIWSADPTISGTLDVGSASNIVQISPAASTRMTIKGDNSGTTRLAIADSFSGTYGLLLTAASGVAASVKTSDSATQLTIGSGAVVATFDSSAGWISALAAIGTNINMTNGAGINMNSNTIDTPTLDGIITLAGTNGIQRTGANLTIDLTDAATRTLFVVNSTASQQCDIDLDGIFRFRNNTSFWMALSGTPTANRIHTIPDVANDTFTLLDATQTITNKTLTDVSFLGVGASSATANSEALNVTTAAGSYGFLHTDGTRTIATRMGPGTQPGIGSLSAHGFRIFTNGWTNIGLGLNSSAQVTALGALATNLTFDNTATRQIAGIIADNLLDKTATESITGAYTFDNDVVIGTDGGTRRTLSIWDDAGGGTQKMNMAYDTGGRFIFNNAANTNTLFQVGGTTVFFATPSGIGLADQKAVTLGSGEDVYFRWNTNATTYDFLTLSARDNYMFIGERADGQTPVDWPTVGTGSTFAMPCLTFIDGNQDSYFQIGHKADDQPFLGAENEIDFDIQGTTEMTLSSTGLDVVDDVRARQGIFDGDNAGVASTNSLTGATDTPTTDPGWASSSTVDMNAPDGYMKAYVGTQAVVIPYWNT